ncbi:MAG TPA: 30S ribosomal protein S16 [Candidatus Saccharimonadales bacterium]
MLAIRMQRTGRSGYAQFRMIVQDSRFHPSSGRVVAYLGNYDPHSKQSNFDKDKLQSYLANGAQPSTRVIKLLKSEKIKLPEWVQVPAPKKKDVRNPDKRRSTRPEGAPEPEAKAPEEAPEAEEAAEAPAEAEIPAEESQEAPEPAAEEAKPEPEAEESSPPENPQPDSKN